MKDLTVSLFCLILITFSKKFFYWKINIKPGILNNILNFSPDWKIITEYKYNYKKIYEEIVFPALRRFNPYLILVSAGFDAHWDDPLANLNLSLTGYNWISRELIKCANEICSDKIIFFLDKKKKDRRSTSWAGSQTLPTNKRRSSKIIRSI